MSWGARPIRTGPAVALAFVLALGCLLVAGGTRASALTFGSPLAQPPNIGFGCEAKPTFTSESFHGDYFLLASGQPDCTWFQSGVIGSVDYSDPRTGSVPADGVITNVAVRSGPNPAAIRIVIVRQIGGLAGGSSHTAGCCAFVSETPPAGTPPLQPAPNAVTNFPVAIPVERNVRGTSAVADFVGISAISGTGTLPLLDTGDNNTLSGYTVGSPDAGFVYPRLGALEAPGGGTRNNESIPNVELLVQWTWQPLAAPVVPPAPVASPAPLPAAPPPSLVGRARLGGAVAPVTAGQALVQLVCGQDAACAGRLALLGRAAVASAKAEPVVYGRSSYSIGAGRKATVKVRLNRRGKALLRTRRQAKVDLRLLPNGGKPVTLRLTLRREAAKSAK